MDDELVNCPNVVYTAAISVVSVLIYLHMYMMTPKNQKKPKINKNTRMVMKAEECSL